jgi:hypothetical protein
MTTITDVKLYAKLIGADVDCGKVRGLLDVTITAPCGRRFTATGSPYIVGHQLYGQAAQEICADMLQRMMEGLTRTPVRWSSALPASLTSPTVRLP